MCITVCTTSVYFLICGVFAIHAVVDRARCRSLRDVSVRDRASTARHGWSRIEQDASYAAPCGARRWWLGRSASRPHCGAAPLLEVSQAPTAARHRPRPPVSDTLLTLDQARAALIGDGAERSNAWPSIKTLRRAYSAGQLAVVQPVAGGRVMVWRSELMRWASAPRVALTPPPEARAPQSGTAPPRQRRTQAARRAEARADRDHVGGPRAQGRAAALVAGRTEGGVSHPRLRELG